MRLSVVIPLVGGAALCVGMLFHLKGRTPSTAALPPPSTAMAPSQDMEAAETEPVQPGAATPNASTPVAVQPPPSTTVEVEAPVAPHPLPTPFSRDMDTLVSAGTSFQEKQAALGRLQASGQLDQTIDALNQGAAEHPTAAAYPAVLGQAQLRKAGELAQAGARISEMGMLGMQADQNFDRALELDPTHWEAQFFKAAAMAHWPLELNKGEEVIDRFSNLIDQQDTMAPQPHFAQTYVLLGDQYNKMGQPDYAVATWQLGARKFPGEPLLRQKLRGE